MVSFKGRPVICKGQSSSTWHSRGYLPHFDVEGMTQHVCFGLADSLPQHLLRRWREQLRSCPESRVEVELRKRVQEFLDSGYGCCFLRDDRVAEVIENAFLQFDGIRYRLHAWCVMPNHIHVLFTQAAGSDMSKIVHSWKSFTANECNKLLERDGAFWQKDYFDRYIRNEQHYRNALVYIERNPVKARLCERPEDWPWSSARRLPCLP